MKKTLLVILCFVYLNKSNAQVVFCPPGTEWHYLFEGSIFSPGSTHNETIKYIGDSISGTDTIKFLMHSRFYTTCGSLVYKTFLRQKGDTVFFYNPLTQGTWQILYNFGALPGQSWQTSLLKSYTTTITFTFTVQSVSTVTINGLTLRELTITAAHWAAGTTITERIGSNSFLFNFSHRTPGSCDGNVFMGSLCYSDNSFGTIQFTDKSCNYYTSNGVSIIEERTDEGQIRLYPNPAKDLLFVDVSLPGESEMSFIDIYGKEVKKLRIEQKSRIDVSGLNKGIYFLVISSREQIIYKTKFIKD